MPNRDYFDRPRRIVYLIEYAPIAYPDTPEVCLIDKFATPGRSGLTGKGVYLRDYAVEYGAVKFINLLARAASEDDGAAVSHPTFLRPAGVP